LFWVIKIGVLACRWQGCRRCRCQIRSDGSWTELACTHEAGCRLGLRTLKWMIKSSDDIIIYFGRNGKGYRAITPAGF